MRRGHQRLLAAVLECVGITVAAIGIGVELATQAHFFHVLITAGSCLVAVGGMLWAKVKI